MGSQIVIRIDDKTKKDFYRLVRMEGKSASEKIREMVESYVEKSDIGPVVDDLWGRIGVKIREKGFGEEDIERVIRESRSGR